MNIPDKCTECAKCCCNLDAKWVEVTFIDSLSIPCYLTQKGDVEPFAMRMVNNRCIALKGKLCSIYENRPTICRTVQPGDAICLSSLLTIKDFD